ncbi:MAG: beta-propeller fold lactonase family protein [Pirellulaceae bacterium]|nr:beta-propeller fold lactonase family protein [Pirellulaceae bacterium]
MFRQIIAVGSLGWLIVVAGRTALAEVDRSPLQVAVSSDGLWGYTANRTANSISRIDLTTGTVAAEFPVGAGPTGIAVSADGQTVYVANRKDDSLSVVSVTTEDAVKTIPLANQPYDVIVATDGSIYVSCVGKDEVVQVIDSQSLTVTETIVVDANPRHLAFSEDGQRLLVTCDAYDTTRWLNVIDRVTHKVVQRVPLEMTSNLRGVALAHGNVAVIAHLNPNPFSPLTQVQQGWVNTNALSFIYLNEDPVRHVMLLLDEFTRYHANPHDVVITPDGRFAWVSCGGADEVLLIDVDRALELIQETPQTKRPQLRSRLSLSPQFVTKHIPVGRNPYGLAMSADGSRVLVANHLGNSVSVIDTASGIVSATIDVGSAPQPTQLRRGEILFHSASICFQGQFSCASCHPDGHTTGLSWDLEDDGLGNPKNIRSFLGVKGTEPFRWQGEAPTIGAHECGPTVSGAMRGPELSASDLAALTAFVTELPLMPNPYQGLQGEISEAAERGRQIFEEDERCTECHATERYSIGQRRNIGLGVGRPDDITSPDGETIHKDEFDIPHLLGVWDSAPYLHDGRAKTLLEIFQQHNPHDEHSTTSDLNEDQLRDLVEYLKTL